MTTVTDLMPFAGTIGGGFFVGLLAGYAIKKVIKIVAVIVGLFIAALAYLEYQRIIRSKLDENSNDITKWAYMASKCRRFKYQIILARVIREYHQILVFH